VRDEPIFLFGWNGKMWLGITSGEWIWCNSYLFASMVRLPTTYAIFKE
jgi:hypothetical protein